MKKIILFVILFISASFSESLTECKVTSKKKIVCHSDFKGIKTISVYTFLHNEKWLGKTFFPSDKDDIPAVYVMEFEKFDFHSYSKDYIKLIRGDFEGVVEDSLVDSLSSTLKDIILNTADNFPMPSFPGYLKKRTSISIMECYRPNYVRTYKYDKITNLKTDRKDYFNLDYGTHCEDFLSNDDYFWRPSKH